MRSLSRKPTYRDGFLITAVNRLGSQMSKTSALC